MKNWKSFLSLLLCALMLLGMIPLMTQAQATPYATVDDLPIVTVLRPDMSPFDITITTDEKTIRVSTPSGKKDFDQVSLSLRTMSMKETDPVLKWDKKTKSYLWEIPDSFLDNFTLNKEYLSSRSIVLTKELKKDKKIDKQINGRVLLWGFNADTGDLNQVLYIVTLKDKKDKKLTHSYGLSYHPQNGWRYYNDTAEEFYFFDQEGKALPCPPPAIPATAGEIEGLPNLTFPDLSIDFSNARVKAEAGWDMVEFYYLTNQGNGKISMVYDQAQKAYTPINGEEWQIYLWHGLTTDFGAVIDFIRYTDENTSELTARLQSTPEQVNAYRDGQQGARLEGEITISYNHMSPFGVPLYGAIQQGDELKVTFADYSTGTRTYVEQTYPAMATP